MLGVKDTRYRAWEYGRAQMPVEFARILAAEWNVPLQAFYGDELPSPNLTLHEPFGGLRAEPIGKIKVYGSISAGEGNTTQFDADALDVPIQFARPDFGALVVEGDSMIPTLWPGDTCIFRDNVQPKLDAIVAAELTDTREWVVKRLAFEEGNWVLQSDNTAHDAVRVPFRVAGHLVGLIRDDGPERLIRLNPFGLKL